MHITRRSFIRQTGMLASAALAAPSLYARAAALPKVLILGDSISLGYTSRVRELLRGKAEVIRPDENCQGTNNGILKIDKWLGDTRWDVIHFNFGLHDLKHVDPLTGKNSTDPDHPRQAELSAYRKNLKTITKKLKSTGARLIFATTTPFPDRPGGPLRRAADVLEYNRVALKIMKKNNVAIDDLYAFVLPQMKSLQIPDNVHFTAEGSQALARKVAEAISSELP